AVRIVKLCDRLWAGDRAANKIANQLFDSGTSIGANAAEAEAGQTEPDFVAKLAIARKEACETIYWLRLAIATSVVAKETVAWELDEAQQLKAMITLPSRLANPRSDAAALRGGQWRRADGYYSWSMALGPSAP